VHQKSLDFTRRSPLALIHRDPAMELCIVHLRDVAIRELVWDPMREHH
jgi:hypothetical protein